MDETEFVCSTCGQRIAINSEMKTAIEENGCPVCASPVSDDDFAG